MEKRKAPATCCAYSKDSWSLEAQICNTQEAEAQGEKGGQLKQLREVLSNV